MRILLATSQFAPEPGGVPRLLWQFCAHRPTDIELSIITVEQLSPDTYLEFDREAPFPIKRVPLQRGNGATSMVYTVELAGLLRRWRPDVLFSGVAYPTAIMAAILTRVPPVPLVIYAHSEDLSLPGKIQPTLIRFALKKAAAVATPSHFTRQRVLQYGLDPERVSVVYPGVELLSAGVGAEQADPLDRPAWLEPFRNRWLILTVARLVRRKGQDTVIRALPHLIERIPSLHYLIVGDGPAAADLQELACGLGVQDRVTFAGRVEDADLPACYRACQVFAMPTRPGVSDGTGGARIEVEGFGIVFLEAAAAGKPVIGSLAGGAAEAVVDGETGFLIDPLDLDALVERVLRLALEPETARRMGTVGQKRVQTEFTVTGFAEKLSKILREAQKP